MYEMCTYDVNELYHRHPKLDTHRVAHVTHRSYQWIVALSAEQVLDQPIFVDTS